MSDASLQSRKICFVEVEPEAREYFQEALAGEDVLFVDRLGEVPADTEVVSVYVSEWVGAEFLAAHPALKFLCIRSSGYDNIDLEACRAAGVMMACVGVYGENTVAEHTFALLLALTRRLPESGAAIRSGNFSRLLLEGVELRGRTLGVVGAGRIGQQVIRIAVAFGLNVLAHDINPDPALSKELGFRYVDWEELLRDSDFITLHVPLTPQTRHMINRESLAKCRSGLFIINTARGGLMDTEAVVEALDSGQLMGAGLDVLEDERVFEGGATSLMGEKIAARVHGTSAASSREPSSVRLAEFSRLVTHSRLIGRMDVVLTPHVAYNSAEAVVALNAATITNISNYLEGKPLKHRCV